MSDRRTIVIKVEVPATVSDRHVVSGVGSYVSRWGGTITGWVPGGVMGRRFFDRAARIRRATS